METKWTIISEDEDGKHTSEFSSISHHEILRHMVDHLRGEGFIVGWLPYEFDINDVVEPLNFGPPEVKKKKKCNK